MIRENNFVSGKIQNAIDDKCIINIFIRTFLYVQYFIQYFYTCLNKEYHYKQKILTLIIKILFLYSI